jgi:cell division protein FtsI (penicillin-binding protein 3)
LRLGTVIVLVLFTVIAARLVQLQLADGQAYAAEALKQRLTPVTLLASRGSILDVNGVPLARSADARYVYADPTLVEERDATAAALSPLLGVPKSTLVDDMKPSTHADGTPQRFVYLARGVDISTGQRVEALNLKGIGVKPDQQRQVPGHDLAANLIGFTGWDQSGRTGLEAAYNQLLKGTDGKQVYEAGNDGQEIPNGYHSTTPAKNGSSLQLTIDRDVQYEAQRALYQKLAGTGADMGAAVVLDVRTGAVVAQASYPAYDAANPDDSTAAQRVDQASQSVVEPGSIHKVITIGAALQKGVITPGSTVRIPAVIYRGGVAFPDAYSHGVKNITVPGIFAYSSDVGTIMVADKLGAQNLYDYQKLFGLGQPTGEGMPGEAAGIVQPPSNWSVSSSASVPIGYSVAVTPLQMAAAYLAIANDGEYIQPHLVADTIAPDGTKTPAAAPKKHRVLSPSVAKAEREAMISTTTVQYATAVKAAIPGYLTAGKTGTGQRVVNNHYQSGNVESFIGMTPADNPRYVVAVFSHTPGNGEGENMTPVFKDIMSFTLRHFQVPPDGKTAPDFHVYE